MTLEKNSAESSVEKIYELIKAHLTSLPEDEAMARLEIIDQAHAKARAQTRARRSRKPSKQARIQGRQAARLGKVASTLFLITPPRCPMQVSPKSANESGIPCSEINLIDKLSLDDPSRSS